MVRGALRGSVKAAGERLSAINQSGLALQHCSMELQED